MRRICDVFFSFPTGFVEERKEKTEFARPLPIPLCYYMVETRVQIPLFSRTPLVGLHKFKGVLRAEGWKISYSTYGSEKN